MSKGKETREEKETTHFPEKDKEKKSGEKWGEKKKQRTARSPSSWSLLPGIFFYFLFNPKKRASLSLSLSPPLSNLKWRRERGRMRRERKKMEKWKEKMESELRRTKKKLTCHMRCQRLRIVRGEDAPVEPAHAGEAIAALGLHDCVLACYPLIFVVVVVVVVSFIPAVTDTFGDGGASKRASSGGGGGGGGAPGGGGAAR
jgi:uncharacterized membrane protein YgcG